MDSEQRITRDEYWKPYIADVSCNFQPRTLLTEEYPLAEANVLRI
jgi:hypothetical protein